MRNNQSTNQCAARSCSFTCTFFVFSWQQWQKACVEIYRSHQKAIAYSKNNSSLERVDSRVQHIWRLRVIGSCLWLILRPWSHTPQTFLETSRQACQVCQRAAQQGQTSTPRTPRPTLFEQCVRSLRPAELRTMSGADDQELATPILSLCHSILIHWSIFTTPFLLRKKGSSGPMT